MKKTPITIAPLTIAPLPCAKDIKAVATLTDENAHTEACVYAAEWFRDKWNNKYREPDGNPFVPLIAAFRYIESMQLRSGHLPYELGRMRVALWGCVENAAMHEGWERAFETFNSVR